MVDLNNSLVFPPCTGVISSLRPDVIVYSISTKTIVWGELTAPLERRIPISAAKKLKRYSTLETQLSLKGWSAHPHTWEVGAIGFLARSVKNFLRIFLLSNSQLKFALQRVAKASRRSTFYIWNARMSSSWNPPNLFARDILPNTPPSANIPQLPSTPVNSDLDEKHSVSSTNNTPAAAHPLYSPPPNSDFYNDPTLDIDPELLLQEHSSIDNFSANFNPLTSLIRSPWNIPH
jgi:hypothetical protein